MTKPNENDQDQKNPNDKDQAAAKPVKARLLVDCHAGKCNDVIEADPKVIAALVKGGQADDDADAVAYAESLKKKPG
jgi:hypothetical protein